MAIKEGPNKVPRKFRNLGKSFTEHLQGESSYFFMPFPKNLSFVGKDKDENVILVIRTHWIMYIRYLFIVLFIIIVAALVSGISIVSENPSLLVSMWIVCILTCLSILVYGFIRWFYNVNIITDQRVIDLDFTSALSHSSSEARLERIEDVTHNQIGVLSSVFDIGTLYIQTAGAKAEIEFDNIPKPREVQDILYDLLESKQKGEI